MVPTHPSASQPATVTGGWTTSGWWSWTRCTTSPTRTAARCGRRPSSTARPGCNCCVCPRRWETRMTWRDGSRKFTVSGMFAVRGAGRSCRTTGRCRSTGTSACGRGECGPASDLCSTATAPSSTTNCSRSRKRVRGSGRRRTGEDHAEAPPTSGANTSQRTRLTGSTKGGSFAKSQKTNFQSSTADGKAARAGDAVNRINPVPREEGGEAEAATHGNGAAAGAAAGTARGADPSERRRRRLRIVRRGDGWSRTWRRPWGSSSPRPCYPRCGSYSAGKAATRLRSTSRTAAPSW